MKKKNVRSVGMVRLDRGKKKSNRKSHSDLKTVKISTVKNPLRRQSDPTWYAFYVPWYAEALVRQISVFGMDCLALFVMPTPHFPLNSFGFGRFYIDRRIRRKSSLETSLSHKQKSSNTPAKKERILFSKKWLEKQQPQHVAALAWSERSLKVIARNMDFVIFVHKPKHTNVNSNLSRKTNGNR